MFVAPRWPIIVKSIQPHSRDVSSIAGTGRDAVADVRGCQDAHPLQRRPKSHGPEALARASPGLMTTAPILRGSPKTAPGVQPAVDKLPPGSLKAQSTGGHAEQASNTACGTSAF